MCPYHRHTPFLTLTLAKLWAATPLTPVCRSSISMVTNYCPTAQEGGTCTKTTCSKSHDVLRCEPCNCNFSSSSLQQHLSGKRHLKNVTSKGLANPGTPQLAPPSQSASSNPRSTPQANTSSPPGGKESKLDTNPPITGSVEGGSRNKVPYCATTLQGGTCVDSRCQYRHEVVQCKPCGHAYPASLFNQHQSSGSHLRNVASNGSTHTSTSQHPHPSQRAPPNPEYTPSRSISPLSGGGPSISATDLPVILSHEDGLDFVAERTGTAADHSFPHISHTLSIENSSLLSNLIVQSMKLAPSPNPWCERSGGCIQYLIFLLAAFLRLYLERRRRFNKGRHARSA